MVTVEPLNESHSISTVLGIAGFKGLEYVYNSVNGVSGIAGDIDLESFNESSP